MISRFHSSRSPFFSRSWAVWLLLLVCATLLLVWIPSLSTSGLWDPHEFAFAEKARHLALRGEGMSSVLSLPGLDNTPVPLEQGAPFLPLASVALGFQLFGLHAWSGRLLFAFWGIAGVCVTYASVARVLGRRTGVASALVFMTLPVVLVQSRFLIGYSVALNANAMALGGLLATMLSPSSRMLSRMGWLAVGLFGLCAGYASQGLWIGVSVPLLCVGMPWFLSRCTGVSFPSRWGGWAGGVSLVLGCVGVGLGLLALRRGSASEIRAWVGLLGAPPAKWPTFDAVLLHIGHGLAPWSAFLPFAWSCLCLTGAEEGKTPPLSSSFFRMALLVGGALTLFAHGYLARYTAPILFSSPFLVATACGIALTDLHHKKGTFSLMIPLGVLLLLALFAHDWSLSPQGMYQVFGVVVGDLLPEGARLFFWKVGFLLFGVWIACVWGERGEPAQFAVRRYTQPVHALLGAWNGLFLLAYSLLVLLLFLVGATLYVALAFQAAWVATLPYLLRVLLYHAWWVLLVGPLLVLWGGLLCGDLWASFCRWLRAHGLSPVFCMLGGSLLLAAGFNLWHTPRLVAVNSPDPALEQYLHASHEGDTLALLGSSRPSFAYAKKPLSFVWTTPEEAYTWLTAPDAHRRFLLVEADKFPTWNAYFRSHVTPRRNPPVLHASSFFLVVPTLSPGEVSCNPLDPLVFTASPEPQHRLDAVMENQLIAVGYDLLNAKGERVTSLLPGATYHLRTYFRVLAPLDEWSIFVHIDRSSYRYNGDHKPLGGVYATSLWLPGDIWVDDHSFSLDLTLAPGPYSLFFGLFRDDTRFHVTSGPHDSENRIRGATLSVR